MKKLWVYADFDWLKASVNNRDNRLFIAKFPSRQDDHDVGLWEHFCHLLAKKTGINAASTSPLP